MLKKLFVFSLILILAVNISYTGLVFDAIYIRPIAYITYIIGIPLLLSYTHKKANNVEWLYIGAMLLGLFLHALLPNNEEITMYDSIKWIFLVVIIIASRTYRTPRLVFYFLVAFFIAHCMIAIVENRLQTNLFDYEYVEVFSEYAIDKMDFRAFGLMGHPLYAANVTIIIMSFIMICNDIKWWTKILLLILGSLALISFNSRTAIIVGGCLLTYYYLLYNVKPIFIVLLGIVVYTVFLSDLGSFIQQNSQIFGRLAAKNNLTDSSSQTRLISYLSFWSARWNFQDIVQGGRIIYLPGTDVSLENGILLTISWWGWIVGILKVILELVISYLCLAKYRIKDKVIVMIACWGTAFSNNNTMNTFVFAFFIISLISINSLTNRKTKKSISSFNLNKNQKKYQGLYTE